MSLHIEILGALIPSKYYFPTMRIIELVLLLFCSFLSSAFAQTSEDCVDAHILAPTPILLSNVTDVTIDEVIGYGTEAAELVALSAAMCGPDGYTPQIIDKSYWFAFSAVTSGSFEFMITPEDNGTDYDFAFWRGFCPNDPCSEPIFCSYKPSLCAIPYSKTGVADDPLGTFGADPNGSFEIYSQALPIEAGQNYFLLVDNRNEILQCGVEDNLGFTIEFDGTATIGPLIERPTISPLSPLDTSQILSVCEGDVLNFSVTSVPFVSTYDWISKSTVSDAIVMPNAQGDRVTVEFGAISGQICMEMICPIESLICWKVEVDKVPNLVELSDATTFCDLIDLETRYLDLNGVADATTVFYETETDAMNETNPLISNLVQITGNYWARKTTPNGCFGIVQMTVFTEHIEVEPIDTVRVCDATFYDLTNVTINGTNNSIPNLKFIFFKDSLEAILIDTFEIFPPIAFVTGTYWARAINQNDGPCFDLKPFELIFEAKPDILPIDTLKFCNNSCFDLFNLELIEANGQAISDFQFTFFNTEADATKGDLNNAIDSEVCETNTYWVRAFSSETCFDVEQINVIAFQAPDMDDVTLDIDCEFGCVDLSEQVFTEKNGLNQSDLIYSYFVSEAEAEDGSAIPIADLNICNPTELWLRVVYINDCFDVAKITISGIELPTASLSGGAAICPQTMTNLDITLTGMAPFNIVYTDGINNFSVVAANNTISEPVSPDSTTIYTLVSVTDGIGCAGMTEGTANIMINNAPTVLNFSQDCNLNATEFTITFELEGGDATSYQVNGTAGTLTNNSFTSAPILTGGNYSFEISDGNGCPPTMMSGVFSCECNSIVGEMDNQPVNVCEREPAIAFYLEGENLEKGDVLVFVLHDSPDTTLGAILAVNPVPIFTFDENIMEFGITYYISAVVTKEDLLGAPVLSVNNNPCLQASAGTPVTFYMVPEVNLVLSSDSICLGESVGLTFNIVGVGPFDVNYFDGEKISTLTAIDSGRTISVNPDFSASFFVQSIGQSGVPTCTRDLMNTGQIALTVLRPPVVENFETFCNEEGSLLVLEFDITDGDSDTYEVNGIPGSITNSHFTSDSIPHNTAYQIEVIDINNCPPTILQGVAECYCTPDILVTLEVSKPISCRGEKDAGLNVEPVNGEAPYVFRWSTGEEGTSVANIAAGVTSVTMTDANGCEIIDSIMLEEPTSITASTNVVPINCFEGRDGGILIVDIEGGTGDYTYFFDNGIDQSENLIENLVAGDYSVGVKDENGCTWTSEVNIPQPTQLDVRLGDNLILNLGDSITLDPQINQEQTTIAWESADPTICPDCSNPVVNPAISTQYKVTVTNSSGCMATDEILVQVQNNQRVYIPSAFSPNGDGNNDILRPYASTEVKEILLFQVYSRWGELVYEKKDMLIESGTTGWDGMITNGQKAPVGVYLYYAEVIFKDDNSEILAGDVTLIR